MTSTTLTVPSLVARESVPQDNALRRELGRQHMSATMIYWLARNEWSHPAFEALATWALNETGALHTSQVSHIRNGKMRMMGVKTLDAFGAINVAIWAYQNDRELFKALNTAPVTPQIEDLIERAEVILDPLTQQPLDQGGWMNLYLGYTRIPGVVGGAKGDEDFETVTSKIGRYVSQSIAKSGHDFIEAKGIFAKSFSDPARATKLVSVAAGLDSYDAAELSRDMADICQALERLDGRPRTARALVQELAG